MIVSIGSRAEHAATKSTSPAPTRSSTIATALRWICSSIWRTFRGVNAELISRRYTVCCGGSMLRKKDANRWISAGIGLSATPSAEVNDSGC